MNDQITALRKRASGRDPNEVLRYVEREPYIDAGTVASIQTVFARSRLSHNAWMGRQYDGRIDARNVWRNAARGVKDIFKDRRGQSATKVDVWLIVDASGSMMGAKANRAQDVTATLAEAFKRVPSVSLHIFQHHAGREIAMYRVYERGRINAIEKMLLNLGGGNADGFALEWIGQQALRNLRPDTKPVIIMISDGLPSVNGAGATNFDLIAHSQVVSRTLRDKGVVVLSVAIDGNNGGQTQMYGEDNVVPFDQQSPTRWADLARGLGEKFGEYLR